jgi:hypothetical protein
MSDDPVIDQMSIDRRAKSARRYGNLEYFCEGRLTIRLKRAVKQR